MKRIVSGLLGLFVGLPTVVPGASPLSCSNAHREFLSAFVGAWEVSASTRVGGDHFEATRARAEFRPALDGCAVVELYETIGSEPVFSIVLVLAARDDGVFELARLDSSHGSFTVSTGDLEAGSLTLGWSRDLGDRVLRTRHVYRVESPRELSLQQFLSRADGEPWELTHRADYQRIDE